MDKAVAAFTRLVEEEGRKDLANDLAMSLTARKLILSPQGKQG